MTDRRSFLQSSLVLAAAMSGGSVQPAAAGAQEAAAADHASAFPLFVFEPRFPEAARAAARARRAGAALWAVDGDLTALWYDHLSLAWKAGPRPIAGVTTAPILFLLETLAADHRMKVSWRDVHGPNEPGRTEHVLFGLAAERRDPALVSWIITPRAAVAKA